jgi:hypothetical protein
MELSANCYNRKTNLKLTTRKMQLPCFSQQYKTCYIFIILTSDHVYMKTYRIHHFVKKSHFQNRRLLFAKFTVSKHTQHSPAPFQPAVPRKLVPTPPTLLLGTDSFHALPHSIMQISPFSKLLCRTNNVVEN